MKLFCHSLLLEYCQVLGKRKEGMDQLNVWFLKSSTLHDVAGDPVAGGVAHELSMLEQRYDATKKHPMLSYLPHKLAEFVGDNFHQQLNLQTSDLQAGNPPRWTVAGLNWILVNCLVPQKRGNHLYTFGVIEWQSDLCEGAPRAKCYKIQTFHNSHIHVTLCNMTFHDKIMS